MKQFIKNLIKEIIYLLIILIIFIVLLMLFFNILNNSNFSIGKYLIIVTHFIAIYIIFKLFFYFVNKEIKIDRKVKIKIYLLISGILILFAYFCSINFNILNPVRYIVEIFIESILFGVFPYLSYLTFIEILVLIYLLINIRNTILINKTNIEKNKENKRSKEVKEEKVNIKTRKEINNSICKYILLILVSLLIFIGIGFKIYRLNTIYIVNLDDNNVFLSEIIDAYNEKYDIRILDLSNIEKDKKEEILIRSLINNESETFIIIPEGFKLSMERASTKIDKYNKYNKEIIFLTNKSKDSNLEYLLLLNKIRENAIVYEKYGDFTRTKEVINIINNINLENEKEIKIKIGD